MYNFLLIDIKNISIKSLLPCFIVKNNTTVSYKQKPLKALLKSQNKNMGHEENGNGLALDVR